MRRTFAVLALTAVLASGEASMLFPDPSPAVAANRNTTFLVPANDGYGVAECLTSRSDCGQVVADAWCETQGYPRAVTFGVVNPEDMTGSIVLASTAPRGRAISVTCSD